MLALTKAKKLHLHQLDVDSAFPYADLEEDVFMTPPPGMEVDEGFCLKLLKSLYDHEIGTSWLLNTSSRLGSNNVFSTTVCL